MEEAGGSVGLGSESAREATSNNASIHPTLKSLSYREYVESRKKASWNLTFLQKLVPKPSQTGVSSPFPLLRKAVLDSFNHEKMGARFIQTIQLEIQGLMIYLI